MTDQPSPVDLDAIRERHAAYGRQVDAAIGGDRAVEPRIYLTANACAADVPALIAEVERLREEVRQRTDDLAILKPLAEDVDRRARAVGAEVERLRVGIRSLSAAADVVEAAAAEAFFTDDIAGFHRVGGRPHTWQNIPEQGRENYRRLIRAVFDVASRALLDPARQAKETTDGTG